MKEEKKLCACGKFYLPSERCLCQRYPVLISSKPSTLPIKKNDIVIVKCGHFQGCFGKVRTVYKNVPHVEFFPSSDYPKTYMPFTQDELKKVNFYDPIKEVTMENKMKHRGIK